MPASEPALGTEPAGLALVTGATNGIGFGSARILAGTGMSVLVHGRDEDRCSRVAATLREESGNDRVFPVVADFARLAEVDRLGRYVATTFGRVDVLVNNAGIGSYQPGKGRRLESDDGYELRFAVNYLAHFWLTERTRDSMIASGCARLANVISGALRPLDFDDLMSRADYDGPAAYQRSKLALVMHAFDHAERRASRAVCVNPGWYIPTGMDRPGRPVRDDVATGVGNVMRAVSALSSPEPGTRYVGPDLDPAHLERLCPAPARHRLRDTSLQLVADALARP